MNHQIYQVQSFQIIAPYTLRIDFDDGTCQTINFAPMLTDELYSPLQDLGLFNQVQLDPEICTLVWPNGADFDPATLHDWSQVFYVEETDDFAKEIALTRQNQPLMQFLAKRHAQAKKSKGKSLAEVRRELEL